ncbi:unnamed protein product [Leptosia nina]|uniref:Uncharacterized protein n=1 Tax=Leptosia nina TaxID=320188 RepID=A0AAV1K613_9NEOP
MCGAENANAVAPRVFNVNYVRIGGGLELHLGLSWDLGTVHTLYEKTISIGNNSLTPQIHLKQNNWSQIVTTHRMEDNSRVKQTAQNVTPLGFTSIKNVG